MVAEFPLCPNSRSDFCSVLAGITASRRLGKAVRGLTNINGPFEDAPNINEFNAARHIIAEASVNLRKSEEHFRQLFNDGPHPMIHVGKDGIILALNARFKRVFGYTLEDIQEHNMVNWWPLAYPNQNHRSKAQETWKKALQSALQTGSNIEAGEHQVVCKDGTERIVQISGTVLKEGVLTSFFDITERRRAENRLRLWAESFEHAQLGVAIIDSRNNTFIAINPAYAAARGYTQDELSGAPSLTISPAEVAADIQKQMRAVDIDAHGVFESEHITKDGRRFPVLLDVTVLQDEEGRPASRIVYALDLTERKQAEQKLRELQETALHQQKLARIAALNQMQDANTARLNAEAALFALRESEERYRLVSENGSDVIWLYDLTTKHFAYVSPSVQRLCGYSVEEVMLHNMEGFLMPDSSHLVPTQFQNRLAGFNAGDATVRSQTQELLQPCKDGTTVPTEVVTTLITDSHGSVTHIQGVTRNISDRKKAEEEKNNLESRLQQAQKMEAIGTLAGGIAHDLNNILGVIIGYAEIACDSLPPESDSIEYLDKVRDASYRASGLVKQILTFSRQSVTERIPLLPAIIIKEALKLLRPSLPSTIIIKPQIDDTAQPILADPTEIHQILMNLCTNAFHAMEQTGGTLDITLKKSTLPQKDLKNQPGVRPGNFAVLSIGDSGPGIPVAIRDKIFDPYFTTKEVGKGTGMGLAIIHGIIKKYGGFITCESALKKGTTFHVFFPTIDEVVTDTTKPVEIMQHGQERILLIDDEEILVDLGKTMLEHLGYKVTVRTNSLEALTTFQNQPDQFDAVVTDQTMPGMTGMDIVRRMLQIRSDIPIILCTGYSNIVNEEQAKSYGIKGFIMKPMTKKNLAALLRKVLDAR